MTTATKTAKKVNKVKMTTPQQLALEALTIGKVYDADLDGRQQRTYAAVVKKKWAKRVSGGYAITKLGAKALATRKG